MLFGCTQPQEPQVEEAQEAPQEEDIYQSSSDLKPTAPAKQFDDFIRPLLEDIFGGVKLADYATIGYVIFDYVVKEPITENHLNQLIASFESLGYQTFINNRDEGYFKINLLKKVDQETTSLSMEGNLNQKRIGFSISVSQD